MLATVFSIGGCGGSGSALNKQQLAAKANQACAQTNKTLKGVLGHTGTSTQDIAKILALEIPAIQAELNHIKSLTPDSSVKSDYATYVSSESQVLSDDKSAYSRALANDASGMNRELVQSGKPGSELLAAARRLGWTVCLQT